MHYILGCLLIPVLGFLVNLIRRFENLCLLSSLLKLYSITKVWISSEAVEPKMFLVIGSLVVFKKGLSIWSSLFKLYADFI